MIIINCLFRVGTYSQVLYLFIKTITVCGKVMTKYIATNNMETKSPDLGWHASTPISYLQLVGG